MRRRAANLAPVLPPAPTSSPRRRGRPPVISDEKILETARNVFLEHGIRAATAEVAARANISEGTIFHRFKSKDALFRAAMRIDPAKGSLLDPLVPPPGEPDLRGTLVTLGNRILELVRTVLPVIMMSWSNPTGEYSLEKLMTRGAPVRSSFDSLCGFFDAEMAAGRLARSDVQILARAFVGALRDYGLNELLQSKDPKRPPATAFVEGLVDLLFRPTTSAPLERTK